MSKPEKGKDPEAELYRYFIQARRVLVVDPSSASRSGICRALSFLGTPSAQIHTAQSLDQALELVRQLKPDIIITEYNLGRSSGIELVQEFRKAGSGPPPAVVLVTSNCSQSAIAQAAEEEVEAFLLKPFTPEVLRRTIIRTALLRLKPPPYLAEIEAGKKMLESGNAEDAEFHFSQALKLDPKPSLACYYLAQAKLSRNVAEQAKSHYEDGLQFNRIHYKCLQGLYELHQKEGRKDLAYSAAKKLAQYFPANSKRLADVVRLAIENGEFAELERYYAIFTNLNDRDENLVNHISAGMVVCGKFHLKEGRSTRALEAFGRAVTASAKRPSIVFRVAQALIDSGQPGEASRFLKRLPLNARQTEECQLLELQILDLTAGATEVLSRGRQLRAQGIRSERLFEILIRRTLQSRIFFGIEDLVAEACALHPSAARKFRDILHEARGELRSQMK